MATVPEAYHDLFEKPTIAHVTTVNPDGDRLLVNTERHRREARNAERDPHVAASMTDPDDDYRYLSVTGEVDEVTTDGAREHIDVLARRDTGDDYAVPIESERVILRIRPDDVITGQ
ncbi:pyridoxamine 5'-phosphate oxidase-related, FMN-binding [Halarchaeum acidiphilum MH1-52-1]|uniref:Pyridoxamine 5'-phosphate oxidase-related, FMN-binding n=1 Tax=Halarchaeum acidiphilum MH1-52-1 TaxID=1261545 RepID=U2YXK9_9EURY|nr:pyridoxamine 5'-phosphate oxidase family protein [Halarchaeum acidiphilum]GAD53785.1 pyridoxamine 5'-phosphate oxidase-related, FMN-binding [Halarchaeum acidiphilum MH1-52-1]